MDRRSFLAATSALAATGCTKSEPPLPPGELLSTSHALGHRMRDGGLPAATETRKAKVVIVGAGLSGLAAAWRLRRAGFSDFEILELEAAPGGNARWSENAVTRYPWGSHYIPLPTRESRPLRLLLAELGILLGDPEAETPRYEERALCQAPQERLYRNGTWDEHLVPIAGRSRGEVEEWERFQRRMREFQQLRGKDGRRAFVIPAEHSSRDPAILALDRITMGAWLQAEGFHSEAVRWVVNYACRDDYGCEYRVASAWAGIHYFACRVGAARDADHDAVLTWPEGNGFVVRELMKRYAFDLKPAAIVHRMEEGAKGVTLTTYLARENRSVAIEAEHVIWAAPFGFAARAFANAPAPIAAALGGYDYAPWITANLALSDVPYIHHGAPLSWDNVLYDSPSLGYVVATHQGLQARPGPTVLTWYLPLATDTPAAGRKRLLETTREQWAGMALAELAKPHPEIRQLAERVDVFANGHAMVIPKPGRIWGGAAQAIAAHKGRVRFAHGDASGLSLIEEAVDRGVAAAESTLGGIGVRSSSFRWNY